MKGQKGPFQQLQPSGGEKGRRQVAVLVGGGVKGDPVYLGHCLSHRFPRQEAGHIGIGKAPGAVGNTDSQRPPLLPFQQAPQHLRQLTDMMKKSITLPQAQLPLPHREEFPSVADSAALWLVFCRRGGVIAGINPQEIRPIQLPSPCPFRPPGSGRSRPAPR